MADRIITFVNFLNENQGALSLLFSFIVMLATVAYVTFTRRLARETVHLRQAETEPNLAVYVIPEDRWLNFLDMVICNFGRGAAKDIKWEIVADMEELKNRKVQILEMSLFRGMNYLPPGEKIRFFFGRGINLLQEPSMKPIIINATYKNDRGEQRKARFTIDVEEYRGMRSPGRPAEYEVADVLKKISENIDHIARALRDPISRRQ